MKTIEEKKIYKKPLMDTILIQNHAALLAGSTDADVREYDDGGEIGG